GSSRACGSPCSRSASPCRRRTGRPSGDRRRGGESHGPPPCRGGRRARGLGPCSWHLLAHALEVGTLELRLLALGTAGGVPGRRGRDRNSTRLNSSHVAIS